MKACITTPFNAIFILKHVLCSLRSITITLFQHFTSSMTRFGPKESILKEGIFFKFFYNYKMSLHKRYSIPLTVNQDTSNNVVIKWKHFPRCWSPVNSPHKGLWRGTLMFPLICASINAWLNNREAGDLRRSHAHYDVIVMRTQWFCRPTYIVNTRAPNTEMIINHKARHTLSDYPNWECKADTMQINISTTKPCVNFMRHTLGLRADQWIRYRCVWQLYRQEL